ncbi:hypothetical protein PIB30_001403 [Stylosanthes scabra]|uniref:Uncharacterized protein n=1 Tax=Stylosanthes scabra TaxID=79078 RepID=A0ABU6YZN7_9FABA|nr:hypothetical protein [Stylosanthes scabra]
MIELLTEMQIVHNDVGGPSSSAGGAAGVIPCSPIHFATPEVSMHMELNSREDSDDDFVSDMEDSSETSDNTKFVLESYSRRGFLLPAPAPIPDSQSWIACPNPASIMNGINLSGTDIRKAQCLDTIRKNVH